MSFSEELIAEFRDKEYRESYAAGFLSSWISHQLTVVRRQRGLTQEQLAELVGTKQPGVSRMERDGYSRWNFATLQKVAFALGCRLKVSLETFGELVKETQDFSESYLQRPAFEQDPVFVPNAHWHQALSDPSPMGEMRRKLWPWLWDNGPLEKLADWLQGYDLPPAGDEMQPHQWLLEALPRPEHRLDADLSVSLADRVRIAIRHRWDAEPPGSRKEDLSRNLITLAEGLRQPAVLGEAIWHSYSRRMYLPPSVACDSLAPWHPLVRAMIYNQTDERFEAVWKGGFLAQRDGSQMADYVSCGMAGMSYMPSAPNIMGIVEAARMANEWSSDAIDRMVYLERGFRRIWTEFPENRMLKFSVVEVPSRLDDSWSEIILAAWRQSVGDDIPTETSEDRQYVEAIRTKFTTRWRSRLERTLNAQSEANLV